MSETILEVGDNNVWAYVEMRVDKRNKIVEIEAIGSTCCAPDQHVMITIDINKSTISIRRGGFSGNIEHIKL